MIKKTKNKILFAVGVFFLAGIFVSAQTIDLPSLVNMIIDLRAQLTRIEESQKNLGGIKAFGACWLTSTGGLAAVTRQNTANSTTTSPSCNVGKSDNANILFQVGSVAAGTNLHYSVQFSYDNSNWFNESFQAAAPTPAVNAVFAHSATSTHRFTSDTVGTTTVAIPVFSTQATYMRVLYSLDAAGGNVTGLISKQEDQN